MKAGIIAWTMLAVIAFSLMIVGSAHAQSGNLNVTVRIVDGFARSGATVVR